jgi:hypothetical protein
MEKLIHDQSKDRHIINVPMPFTEAGLKYFIATMNGWEDQPDVVQDFVDHIIDEGRVDLNPSSSLGEGANIVDVFSFGLMALAKMFGNPAPNINDLWIHPCRNSIILTVDSINVTKSPVHVKSNEQVMYTALDRKSGAAVTAEEASGNCPGNSDNLEAYGKKSNDDDSDELPF